METFTDDTVVALASFLSPHDMLSLVLTCKRFGAKNGTSTKRSSAKEEGTKEVRQRTESISLMEVAARTVLFTLATDEETNALPRRGDESWIGLYQQFLKLFRSPLQFDKLVGQSIDYDLRGVPTTVCSIEEHRIGTAICSNIMRAGKHYVSFQVNDKYPSSNLGITCGIMRPTREDITSLEDCNPADDLSRFSLKDYEMLHGNDNVDCCLLSTWLGNGLTRKRWKKWKESELMAIDEEQRLLAERRSNCQTFHWEGMEGTQAKAFKIGMVLDLDEGTLEVYKNGRRLGTLKWIGWRILLGSLNAQFV